MYQDMTGNWLKSILFEHLIIWKTAELHECLISNWFPFLKWWCILFIYAAKSRSQLLVLIWKEFKINMWNFIQRRKNMSHICTFALKRKYCHNWRNLLLMNMSPMCHICHLKIMRLQLSFSETATLWPFKWLLGRL